MAVVRVAVMIKKNLSIYMLDGGIVWVVVVVLIVVVVALLLSTTPTTTTTTNTITTFTIALLKIQHGNL